MSITVFGQSSFLTEFGTPNAHANEHALILFPEDDLLTVVYREQGGAAGGEAIVFERRNPTTGELLGSDRYPVDPQAHYLAGTTLAGGDRLLLFRNADGGAALRRFAGGGEDETGQEVVLDDVTLTETVEAQLAPAADGGARAIVYDFRERTYEFFGVDANLALASVVQIEGWSLGHTILPDGRVLILRSGTQGGFGVDVRNFSDGALLETADLPGSNTLGSYGAGRFARQPNSDLVHITFTQTNTENRNVEPVLYPLDLSDGLAVGGRYALQPLPSEQTAFLQAEVSPRGGLQWIVDGLLVLEYPNYETAGTTFRPVAGQLTVDGETILGRPVYADSTNFYLFETRFRNSNDRDVFLVRGGLGGAEWSAAIGWSTGRTDDDVASLDRDLSGNLYALTNSPNPEGTDQVPTVFRLGPDGGQPEVIWRAAPTEEGNYRGRGITYRSDGRLIVQYEGPERTFTAVLQPDGTEVFPESSVERIGQRTLIPDGPTDTGGGTTVMIQNRSNSVVVQKLRTDGRLATTEFLPSFIAIHKLRSLPDNGLIALGRRTNDQPQLQRIDPLTLTVSAPLPLNVPGRDGLTPVAVDILPTDAGDWLVAINQYTFDGGLPATSTLEVHRFDAAGNPVAMASQPTRYVSANLPTALSLNAAGELVWTTVRKLEAVSYLTTVRLDAATLTELGREEVTLPYENYFIGGIVNGAGGYAYALGSWDQNGDGQAFLLGERTDLSPSSVGGTFELEGAVRVYPVPAAGPQTLSVDLPVAGRLELTYFDALGRLLGRRDLGAQRTLSLTIYPPARAALLRLTDERGRGRTVWLGRR